MEKKQKVKIKLRVKKDDRVKIIAGDDKGKTGKVLEIITDTNRAIVKVLTLLAVIQSLMLKINKVVLLKKKHLYILAI